MNWARQAITSTSQGFGVRAAWDARERPGGLGLCVTVALMAKTPGDVASAINWTFESAYRNTTGPHGPFRLSTGPVRRPPLRLVSVPIDPLLMGFGNETKRNDSADRRAEKKGIAYV